MSGRQGATGEDRVGRSTESEDRGVWRSEPGNKAAETGRSFLIALAICAAVLIPGGLTIYSDHSARESARVAEAEKMAAYERLVAASSLGVLPVDAVAHGRDLFVSACAACHSAAGTGVPGLGKDLTRSWFVAGLDDGGLHGFIREGRAADAPGNTTRMPMPPNGGRADLTDEDVGDIVLYMRALQDPRRMPELPAMAAPAPAVVTDDDMAIALAAAGGDEELAEYIASGTKLYASSCAACHGQDGRGLKGNGKDLVDSAFCDSLDDEELLAFIQRGRDPGDPANTTGVGMPARGGNPALNEDDILDIIAYLRSLKGPSASAE